MQRPLSADLIDHISAHTRTLTEHKRLRQVDSHHKSFWKHNLS